MNKYVLMLCMLYVLELHSAQQKTAVGQKNMGYEINSNDLDKLEKAYNQFDDERLNSTYKRFMREMVNHSENELRRQQYLCAIQVLLGVASTKMIEEERQGRLEGIL